MLFSIIVLVVGLVLASLARVGVAKLLAKADEQLARYGASDRGIISPKVTRSVSVVTFWIIVVAAVSLALLSLDASNLTAALDTAAGLTGRIIAALAIIGIGYLLGFIANLLLRQFGHLSGSALWVAPAARWGIVMISVIMALAHLQIDTTLVTSLIVMISGLLVGGLMLAFALGARETVSNLLGGAHLKRFRVGEKIKINDIEGVIVELRSDGLDLETHGAIASVPAWVFLKEPVFRLTEARIDEHGE